MNNTKQTTLRSDDPEGLFVVWACGLGAGSGIDIFAHVLAAKILINRKILVFLGGISLQKYQTAIF